MSVAKAAVIVAALAITLPPASASAQDARILPSMLVSAQSYVDVINMLEKAGYRVSGMKTTLLGRVKIRAQNRQHLREVVVSRSTGEIKSDRIIRVFRAQDGATAQKGKRSSGSSSGSQSGSGVNVDASVSSGGTSAGASVSAGGGSAGASVSVGGTSASVGLGG